MSIVLTAVGKGGDHTLPHDLNFQSERYEAKHQVVSEARIHITRTLLIDFRRPSGIPSQSSSPSSKSPVLLT